MKQHNAVWFLGRWETVEKTTEQLKYEIAGELGLLDRVKKFGWKSLSAKETGMIGGLVTKKKRQMMAKENKEQE